MIKYLFHLRLSLLAEFEIDQSAEESVILSIFHDMMNNYSSIAQCYDIRT